jgi:SAM-dependent methyltransferase
VAIHDHFSGVAADYARYRPDYPAALFDWLADVAPRRETAWDCACGSGQATAPLAARFSRVAATDVSVDQLRKAPSLGNVVFAAGAAEAAPLAGRSADCVVVGQALHWFDLQAFCDEARRVLVPGGVVAAWTYGLPAVDDPEIEDLIRGFVAGTLGPWWPPEVAHVLDGYTSLELPFTGLEPPSFEMAAGWTLGRFLDFVRTWSGVARFVKEIGEDPVEKLAADLGPRWSATGDRRNVRWRLKVRAGRT